ncbi:hypothetical protein GALMADRAFT_159732 [Galerina marginata CBS 339.88]|uniref:Uncharacterized protein n=1 Tax=Galerina marginata (strain CBS 339.88) TaxID=685588 RepID=A0A067SJ54_GALM3|nr:hypothetical protein GALMADRAFT_159732 [Galerina marginata CBS 339.88]
MKPPRPTAQAASLMTLLAPGVALGGAAHGAGAHIPGYRRDEATEAAYPTGSATDAVLGGAGDIIGTLYRLLAPGAALGGAARGAGAYIPGYRRDEASEAYGPGSATDAVLGAGGDIIGDLFRLLAPGAALRGAAHGAGAYLPSQYGYHRRQDEVEGDGGPEEE